MNKKLLIILGFIVVIVLVLCVAASSHIIESQEKTNLKIISNSTLFNGDDITVKLTNESGEGIANKTVNLTLIKNGEKINLVNTTDSEGLATFDINVTSGNYSVECDFKGDDYYKESNVTSNVTILDMPVKAESKNLRYNDDDHLSCDELKAKYPEMTDEELFERFGERGDNGKMYNGHYVWEDRGDGHSYSGNPIY